MCCPPNLMMCDPRIHVRLPENWCSLLIAIAGMRVNAKSAYPVFATDGRISFTGLYTVGRLLRPYFVFVLPSGSAGSHCTWSKFHPYNASSTRCGEKECVKFAASARSGRG